MWFVASIVSSLISGEAGLDFFNSLDPFGQSWPLDDIEKTKRSRSPEQNRVVKQFGKAKDKVISSARAVTERNMQGAAFNSVYILLKDKENAEKATRVLGVLPVPRLLHTSACRVLKGELVAPIPPGERVQRNDGQMPHNYRTLTKDTPATFYHDEDELDLSPLSKNDYDVLAGIKLAFTRYQFFIERGKLDWATKLKKGDKVLVELPMPGENTASPKVSAVIRYVGPVQTLPGVTFGVEIKDQTYFGWGTSNGVFQDEQYFRCKEDCGLFVSADKIFPVKPLPAGSPEPAQKHGGKGSPGTESNVDNSYSGYRYKIGDRVVVFTKKGDVVHGTVKWVGIYSFTVGKKTYSHKSVGIETDVKVKTSEVEGFPVKTHFFVPAKDRSAVFLSEDEVLPEADFAEGKASVQASHVGSKERELLREAMHDNPELVTESVQSAAIAREAGILTEMVRQDAAARRQMEQSRQEEEQQRRQEEMEEIKQAVPDQSLNISGQERMLRQISDERHRVGDQIAGGRGGGRSSVGTEAEGRWEVGGRGERREGEMRPERRESGHTLQKKEHIYDTVGGGSTGNVPPNNGLHNQPPGYQPPPEVHSATNPQQYGDWSSRQNSGAQPPAPYSQWSTGLPPTHHQMGSSYPHSGSPHLSHSAEQPNVPAGPRQPVNPPPHPGQHRAYVDPHQPTPVLDVGSPVELLHDSSRHGVVRWLGTLPEIQGFIAGVELDDPMQGCGDGEWKGHHYFTCLPGRGFFCPVTGLKPDPRLPPATQPFQRSTGVNPLNTVPDWEEQDQTIAGNQIVKYTAEGRGIQGHQNSCYLDATIFGLFALSDVFDSLFLDHMRSLTSLQSPTPTSPIQREVGTMLWKGIVNPLRKNGAVRFESVMRLRNKLEELGKMEGVNTSEKDPEEFLNMLFKHTLHVDPFIHIKRPFGTEPEFFVQLFVEFDGSIKVPTIEKLLIKMFREQQISFAEVPSKLLVQVPRYGREFQAYKRIVPGIKFDTTSLLETSKTCYICGDPARMTCTQCSSGKDFRSEEVNFCIHCSSQVHRHKDRVGHNPVMCPGLEGLAVELELLSVLCIETSHYVCFSRDSEGRWLFFDSMADRLYDQFNIPRGVECTAQLNKWVYEGDQERLMAVGPRELPELVRRFTQDVYMCVYIQPDYGMYG